MWRLIAPLLPNKPCGVARVDDRRIINAIFYVLRTGWPWRAGFGLTRTFVVGSTPLY